MHQTENRNCLPLPEWNASCKRQAFIIFTRRSFSQGASNHHWQSPENPSAKTQRHHIATLESMTFILELAIPTAHAGLAFFGSMKHLLPLPTTFAIRVYCRSCDTFVRLQCVVSSAAGGLCVRNLLFRASSCCICVVIPKGSPEDLQASAELPGTAVEDGRREWGNI